MTSIILPTRDRAYILWRAIESVRAQTVDDWELIVVDDGSTDCTMRMLEEFRDERIRSVKTSRVGPSAARNRGLTEASGDFIAYLDSDNTWHEDFLETMLAGAQKDEADFWYCGAEFTMWERSASGEWALIERRAEPRRQYSLEDAWNLKAPDTNCMFHREGVAEAIGGWDEDCRWLEDWDFFLRAFRERPDRIQWVPEILVDYRQVHGEGADGICAEAREDGDAEVEARAYLLEKWGDHPDFSAAETLNIEKGELELRRFS
jgi:glycosyltransferase involved in cell wall biosynthesis